ncbi:MAG: hydantoinase/oxoprolinase family protein, partial [SAR324 cluster bacterium]|nr:hydantoinase/oxoprolinase family protein [SAR324 cluster bacterium]
IMEVDERIGHDGAVVRKIDMDSVARAIDALLEKGVESIAVTLLHAYANPVHEQMIGEHLRSRAPGMSISLSCEVSPKYREYERTSTTVANAYIKPIVERYIGGLEKLFAEKGFRGALYTMQSSGGLMNTDLARKYPITIVESGPSAGVLMCSIVGRREGFLNVLTFDMGGTTAKVGAMEGGEPAISQGIEVDGVNLRKYSGLPLNIPAIELIEIGAGGGSMAHIEMGLIRVGPQSAGAEPGPICYGMGGEKATLTDANLVLGYINPDNFAGGSMKLDVRAAAEGIARQIAEPLGLSLPEAAWGIHAVANASMEQALRSMSMDRGRDPRNYAMVAFGGAGPLHAGRLARALGVPQVVVPWGAGVGSAVGLLDADPKFSVARTHLLRVVPEASAAIAAIYTSLEERVRNEVRQIEHAAHVDWQRYAYLRYEGQGYELKIDLPPGDIGAEYAGRIMAAFHEAYQSTYGYSQADNMIEATDWHLTATIPTGASSNDTASDDTVPSGANAASAAAGNSKDESGNSARVATRKAYFQEFDDFIECQVIDRYALRPGDRFAGPAIVEERESTTIVLPGDSVEVRPARHLIITMGGAQ